VYNNKNFSINDNIKDNVLYNKFENVQECKSIKTVFGLKEISELLDLLSECAYITRPDKNAIYVNPALIETFGFSNREDFLSAHNNWVNIKKGNLKNHIGGLFEDVGRFFEEKIFKDQDNLVIRKKVLSIDDGEKYIINILDPSEEMRPNLIDPMVVSDINNAIKSSSSLDETLKKLTMITSKAIKADSSYLIYNANGSGTFGSSVIYKGNKKEIAISEARNFFEGPSFARDINGLLPDGSIQVIEGSYFYNDRSNIPKEFEECIFILIPLNMKGIPIRYMLFEKRKKAPIAETGFIKAVKKIIDYWLSKKPKAKSSGRVIKNKVQDANLGLEFTALKTSEIEGRKKYSDFLFKDGKLLGRNHELKPFAASNKKGPASSKIEEASFCTFSSGNFIEDHLKTVSLYDLTDAKNNLERIKYLSFHDKLTSLNNRAFFEEAVKRFSILKDYPIGIMMLDLNGLKFINDIFGFDRGDSILVSVAKILKSSVRKKDIVCRYGGDEFIVLIPEADQETLSSIVRKINIKCSQTKKKQIPISLSIGYSFGDLISKEALINLIKEAEDNMYKRKLLENKSNVSLIVTALENVLLEKSYETRAHAKRLLDLSIKLGIKTGLSRSDLDDLALLAKLHDIGKIAIPDQVLKKTSRLDGTEWEIIKKHTEIGYRISQSIAQFAQISNAILSHHEWWDGNGYPNGISGEDIPILSRIISITDAFDVMIKGRPYKKRMDLSDVIGEFKRCSGRQFDPSLVKKFVEVIKNDLNGSY
jgi:diguanylate cyclase (GGDEF)-like protein